MDANISVEINKERERLVRLTRFTAIICTIIEIGVFFYFYQSNGFKNLNEYLFFRVLLPSFINLILYLASFFVNKSFKISTKFKNDVCSILFMLMLSNISINHCFYRVLWILPGLGMFICIPFHKKNLLKVLFVISEVSVIASAVYLEFEYPERLSVHIQNTIVALVINSIFIIIINSEKRFHQMLLSKTEQHLKNEIAFERLLHYDYLTGVFSKEHIARMAQDGLYNCSEKNPVAIAVLNIDNFKKLNDDFGHEKGDIVLKAFGNLLNRHSSENFMIGRFEGDSFIFFAKNNEVKIIKEELNRIRVELSLLTFSFLKTPITISGGLFSTTEFVPYSEVLTTVDILLYKAKRNGKNQIAFE